MQFSENYWTANVRYNLPGKERKAQIERLRSAHADLYRKSKARNTEAQARAVAAELTALGFDIEVNEGFDLAF